MIKANLRGLLQRKLRLGLAVFAILLSVGFLAGALVLTDTLTARFDNLFTTINQNVAVSVSAQDQQAKEPVRLTEAQLRELAAVDGVAAFSGDVSANGVVPFNKATGKPVPAQVSLGFGVDGRDDPLGLVELREGSWPTAENEVVLTVFTAREAGVKRGDQVRLSVPGLAEPKMFTVVGIAGYAGGRDSLAGETAVLFQLAYAQQVFYGAPGLFAGASFAAEDGVSQQQLKERISAELPTGLTAKTGEESTTEQSQEIGAGFDLFKYILIGFAVVAGIVGIFLIFNTFNIIVAQRTRELALLRALGASWGQVANSVLLEALIVGLVGSTVGLAAGIGVGWLGNLMISKGIDLPDSGLVISPLTVILAYTLGMVVTMISAFVPAIRASSVSPIAAMRDVVRPDKSLLGLSITGAAFAALGGGLLALGLLADLGGNAFLVLLAGAVPLLIGSLLLSPLLARPIVRGVGALVGWGQSGRLGVRNALRNPRRTAVTAVALTIGVTLIATAATVVQSFKNTLDDALTSNIGVEVIIQGAANVPPNGEQGFHPSALDKVRAIPGVKETAAWHLNTVDLLVDGQPTFAIAATDVPTAQRMFAMEPVTGSLRKLGEHELVVDDKAAEAAGWKSGDTVKVSMSGVVHDYTVVGIYKASPLVQGIIVGEPAIADFGGPMAFQGFVSLAEGTDANAVVEQVQAIMNDYPGVTVGDQQDYIEQTAAQFDILLTAIQVLLGVALVIALLGILNTLLLSIVERTRELGLVRAIGLNRLGVVWMIAVESILIALFGCLLGLALGVGLGSAFTQALIEAEIASTLGIPWVELLVYLVIALVAGVLAAIWPAWRASRLNVLDAISYE